MQAVEEIRIEIEMILARRPPCLGETMKGNDDFLFPVGVAVRDRLPDDEGEEARARVEQLDKLVRVEIDDIEAAQIAECHQPFCGKTVECLAHRRRASLE